MRWAVLLLLLLVTVGAVAAGCGGGPTTNATVTIRFSRFTSDEITVPAGRPITFTLRNTDPIEHEWTVGDDEMHERHRTGSEPVHDTRPDEVTLPAFAVRTTTLTFDRPGTYAFICHLPGHEAYGMKGLIRVVGR